MADIAQEIYFGDTGAVLSMYPPAPEWQEGVPSAASASVVIGTSSDTNTAEFSPVVTVDSTSLTLAAASQASGRSQAVKNRLYLASTAGLVIGRWYRLENERGEVELVQVVAVSSNAYADLRDPLTKDYAVSASCTLKGIRMTAPVDATWVATEGKLIGSNSASYRVLWAYTVAGRGRKHWTDIRLVREARRHNVTAADIQPYYPSIKLDEPSENYGQQLLDAIDAGYRRLRIDIRTKSIYRIEMIRDPEVVDDLVRAAALMVSAVWATPSGWSRPDWMQYTTAKYEHLLMETIGAAEKVFFDPGTTGAAAEKTRGSFWLG